MLVPCSLSVLIVSAHLVCGKVYLAPIWVFHLPINQVAVVSHSILSTFLKELFQFLAFSWRCRNLNTKLFILRCHQFQILSIAVQFLVYEDEFLSCSHLLQRPVVADLSWYLPEVPRACPQDSIRISPKSALFPESYALILVEPLHVYLEIQKHCWQVREFCLTWSLIVQMAAGSVSAHWETTSTDPFEALVWTLARSKQLLGCCWSTPLFPASVMKLPEASIIIFSGCWSVSEA